MMMLRKYLWTHLKRTFKDIYKKFKFPKSMIITMYDKTAYDNSTLCHTCDEELGKDRVRDHCHLSGRFRALLMKSAT